MNRLIIALLIAVSPATALAQPATATPPKAASAQFSGRVVDDLTSAPITAFAIQWGLIEKPNEPIKWGYSMSTSPNRRNGEFQERAGWQSGQKATVRIIANGYMPQPVSDPVALPSTMAGLTVRMRRGGEREGIVVDHNGQRVAGARVILTGAQPLQLSDGVPEQYMGSVTTADANGHFAISGLDGSPEQRLVISAPDGALTVVSELKTGADLEVQLPSPARLTIKYDIAADDPSASMRMELKTWESSDWRGITCVRRATVRNGGEIELSGFPPGIYDLVREKMLRLGNAGRGAMLDRRTIELQSGERQAIDFIRPGGRSIVGDVVGLKEAGVTGAYIYVRSPNATGNPRDANEWKLEMYDALTCTAEDPKFQTAALLPGTYAVVVEAYLPEEPSLRNRTGLRLPDFTQIAKVTVPADADPKPLTIELKPIGPATRP